MADPRGSLDYAGIQYEAETYNTDGSSIVYSATATGGSAAVGKAVRLTAARTVGLTIDASEVLGKLLLVEADGKATVQTKGYMQLPSGAGAALTLGSQIVGDLDTAAPGFIRAAASAVAAELVVAKGEIIDAADPAAVWVLL